MIQLIGNARQMHLCSSPVIQNKNNNVSAQPLKMTSPYSKEYANASRSMALASMNIQKSQNVSFKGVSMTKLPLGWIFDADEMRIRNNYGVDDKKLEPSVKDFLTKKSDEAFEKFKENGKKSIIPFYRHLSSETYGNSGSQWMPDGYVAIKDDNKLEYVCWKEIEEQFGD